MHAASSRADEDSHWNATLPSVLASEVERLNESSYLNATTDDADAIRSLIQELEASLDHSDDPSEPSSQTSDPGSDSEAETPSVGAMLGPHSVAVGQSEATGRAETFLDTAVWGLHDRDEGPWKTFAFHLADPPEMWFDFMDPPRRRSRAEGRQACNGDSPPRRLTDVLRMRLSMMRRTRSPHSAAPQAILNPQ